MRTRHILHLMLVAALAASCVGEGRKGGQAVGSDEPVFLDGTRNIEDRVEDALSRMTLEEKVAILHAQSKFSSAGVPRLGIPEVWMSDGPHGIRPEVLWDQWRQAGWTSDSCTAFPALTALAATWDPELALLYGKSIGEEARYRKKDVLLGPGVNICRTPLNGRGFEYFGEDPFLSSTMVVPYIKGVQGNGVAACVKHFALNNQETNRFTTEVHVDERTLNEIYLPAFKAAVQEGGAWAVMGSYNLYKGQWNCQNDHLLNGVLKDGWGFDGVVVSDWGGAHDTNQCVEHGLDMEFGTYTNGLSTNVSNAYSSYYLADPYIEGLKSGKFSMETLDDKARRVLRLMFRTVMDRNRPYGTFVSPEHLAAARRIGAESIVLLKNEGGLLPLKSPGKILVVGENAVKMMTIGGGSSSLKVKKEVSPLEGIMERFPDAEITYERGYIGEARSAYDGVEGKELVETRYPEQVFADAVAAAADADVVIFIGGLNKSDGQDAEGYDRRSYGLPYDQDSLIEALAGANGNLVVVNISGNAVAMPWADKVPAILQDWYLGSEAGHSLADVLSGDVNPSGKLPFTIGATLGDYPARTEAQYPGIARAETVKMGLRDVTIFDEEYSEGIFVGYRWFDKEDITPVFPFGYGLSYTTFEYGAPKVAGTLAKGLTVSVPVTNTGHAAGAETVEFYISAQGGSFERPVKELKGFGKVYLEPGETRTVSVPLSRESISYFDAGAHAWAAEKGKYTVLVASSSRDVRQAVEIEY